MAKGALGVLAFYGVLEAICGVLLLLAGGMSIFFHVTYHRLHHGIWTGISAVVVGLLALIACRQGARLHRMVHVCFGGITFIFVLLCAPVWLFGVYWDLWATRNNDRWDPMWCYDACCVDCPVNTQNRYWDTWNAWYDVDSQEKWLSCSAPMYADNCKMNSTAVVTGVMALCASIVIIVSLAFSMIAACISAGQRDDVAPAFLWQQQQQPPMRSTVPLFPDHSHRMPSARLTSGEYAPSDAELSESRHMPPQPARARLPSMAPPTVATALPGTPSGIY